MGITSILKSIGEKVGLCDEPSPTAGPGEGPPLYPWGGVSLAPRPGRLADAPPEPGPSEAPFSGETVQAAEKYLRQKARPDSAEKSRRGQSPSLFYTVKPGDNLWKIAESQYGPGQGEKNHLIYEANKPILSSPDQVHPGQVLRIPSIS